MDLFALTITLGLGVLIPAALLVLTRRLPSVGARPYRVPGDS